MILRVTERQTGKHTQPDLSVHTRQTRRKDRNTFRNTRWLPVAGSLYIKNQIWATFLPIERHASLTGTPLPSDRNWKRLQSFSICRWANRRAVCADWRPCRRAVDRFELRARWSAPTLAGRRSTCNGTAAKVPDKRRDAGSKSLPTDRRSDRSSTLRARRTWGTSLPICSIGKGWEE